MKGKHLRQSKTRTTVRPVIEGLEPRKLLSAYTLNPIAFFNATNGETPLGGVTLDSSGDLFGTTYNGGANNDGTVFEVAEGTTSITTLANFNGTNGENPRGGVTLDSSGDLFGTTSSDGPNDAGTVFEIAQGTTSIITLASFNVATGADPFGGVTLDSSGDLFGTTQSSGGPGGNGFGTVFEIAQGTTSITTLAVFNDTNGANPSAGVTLDSSGDLFGTTTGGGANSAGTVFEIAQGATSINTLASFNTTNGATPFAGVTLDSSGDLFGSTEAGGAMSDGTVFELTQGTSSITTLASFNGANGENPYDSLALDSSGDLFGTTDGGGANEDGTVFEIAQGTSSITDLASFNSTDGDTPEAGLTLDSSGDLFGTTDGGGPTQDGSVFELTPVATDVVVNSVSDTATGAGIVTLSDAVNMADSSTTPTSITFDPTVFAAAQTITLNGSDLELSNASEPTTITGSAAGVTISGNNTTVGFQIDDDVTATLSDLTITDCNNYLGAGITNNGTLTLTDSTLSNNDATTDDDGAGLANEGTATLINDTLADNTGDGLDQRDGAATVIDCTVSGNFSYGTFAAGGIYIDGGTVTIGNSIVAGNTAATGGGDVFGTFTSLGNNLIGQTDGSTGWISSDLTGTIASTLNPELAPLADNGGPTQTLLPYAGSPAIGAGSVALVPMGTTTDQRGLPRIVNAMVDIGAVQGNSSSGPPVTAASIGGLDPTFGVNGLASQDVGFTSTAGVVVQSNGQSVIAGTAGSAGAGTFGITRYNANGSLDTTFGTSGVTDTTLPGDAQASALALLADGDILIAGTVTTLVNGQSTGSQFALAEYTSAGVLDPTFGNGAGYVLTSFSSTAGTLSNDVANALLVGPGGTIYVGGSSDAGGSGTDFAIAAYTPTGSPSTSFGTNGNVLLGFPGNDASIAALALAAKGDLVAAGSAAPSGGVSAVALAEFLPSGALNAKFGVKGQLTTSVGSVDDAATALAIDPKGNIVVGGYTGTGSAAAGTLSANFLLLRYASTGKLDKTFGSGGIVTTSFNQPAAISTVLIDADGTIVASGKTVASLTNFDPSMLNLAVARYTDKGRPDTSFNGTGQVIVNLSTGATTASLATPSETASLQSLSVMPFDATSDLMTAFMQLTQSDTGVIATTTGGDLLDVGNSGGNTVEAAIVAMGLDLAATLVASVPQSVLGGAKGTASVDVRETGTELAQGTFTVELFVSSSPYLPAGGSPFESYPEKLKLKEGAARSLRLSFKYPSSLSKGNYYLVASVSTGTARDLNPANNTSASASSVLIAPPFVLLAGSALTAPVFKGDKPALVSFTLMNAGNVPASAKSAVQFFASTGDTLTGATSLATVPLPLNLKPGASHPFKLKLALPSTLPAGTYMLLALLDPANVFNDPNAATNFIVSGNTFTVA